MFGVIIVLANTPTAVIVKMNQIGGFVVGPGIGCGEVPVKTG
jgi:hypothetical protein